jgi:uracil phosphoribosyltransferase
MARKPNPFQLVTHPLLEHALTEARNRATPSARFRELLSFIGEMLTYEATRDLPLEPASVQTPLETYKGKRLRLPITIVPILRAGLGLAAGIHRVIPEAHMGHIGMFRDEKQLNPISYYEKLPLTITNGPVLLADPMLATGGSAMAAVHLLRNRGCKRICLLCMVASPEGVARMTAEHPKVPIYAAALDRELDDRGYILPGLGDAGDRLFGTSDEK